LQEKFKMIKVALKDWHGAHAQNLPSRIDSLKVRLSALEGKGENEVLSETEIEELHGISTECQYKLAAGSLPLAQGGRCEF
jgi:hypothetical protein